MCSKMEFFWTEPDRATLDRAFGFAASLAGRPASGFDTTAWAACAAQRILALPLDPGWGGDGRSLRLTAAVFEALGRAGADRGLLFSMGAHLFGCALPIARHGTPAHRDRYAVGLADGSTVAALAMTEDEGGTTAARWRTRVRREGADYLVSGAKAYVTNAPVADLFLVFASENPDAGALGLTALLVPRSCPGLRVEPHDSTVGLRGSPMGRVVFDDCRLPADAVLGAPRAGLGVMQSCMRFERTCILAGFVGAAARDLATCVARMKARQGADGPLLTHQAVSHRMARSHCRIEAARSVLYHGADALDRSTATAHDPSMVKVMLSEAVVACALDTMQLLAGAAWTDAMGTGSTLADTVGVLSASGTSEAQLNTIASALPGLYS
jgi:L-prolyl-PCP dehydrogenase